MKKNCLLFFVAYIFLFSNFVFAEDFSITKSTIIGNKQITDTNYYCLYYPMTTKVGTLKQDGDYKIASFDGVKKKFQRKANSYERKYKQAKNKTKKQRFKKLYQKFNKANKEVNTCEKFNTARLACDNFKLEKEANDTQEAYAYKKANTKIINGGKCNPSNSIVAELSVQINGKDAGTCTGTLIEKNVILTAAHCIEIPQRGRATSMKIKIGGETYDALWMQANPKYDYKPDREEVADVALVGLPAELPYIPMPLVSKSTTIKSNEVGAIIGYGITSYKDKDDDEDGFKAGYTSISKVTSSGILSKYKKVFRQSNTCEGDSGGPLAIYQSGEWRIFGVTSGGDDDYCGFFSGKDDSWYSKITAPENVEFIESILGDIYSKD